MFRALMASLLGLIVVAGCGETQHPVRQETMTPVAPEPEGSETADRTAPQAGSGERPSMSAMPGGMSAMSRSAAGSDLKVTAPDGWVVVQPKVSMIKAEFALPKVEGDENDGRLTVMAAGGSVEMNIERWKGQFADLKDKPVEEIDVSGTKVTLVDLSGTFNEQRGMGPVTQRPAYRMLAAILETPDGLLFVKGYGPENTMAKYAEQFRPFVESLASPTGQE